MAAHTEFLDYPELFKEQPGVYGRELTSVVRSHYLGNGLLPKYRFFHQGYEILFLTALTDVRTNDLSCVDIDYVQQCYVPFKVRSNELDVCFPKNAFTVNSVLCRTSYRVCVSWLIPSDQSQLSADPVKLLVVHYDAVLLV